MLVACMPAYRPIDPVSVVSLLGLLMNPGTPVRRFLCLPKMYIDKARNALAEAALEVPGVTHLLWLDDDMVWPPDMPQRLFDLDVAVAGALYFHREGPPIPVPYEWADPDRQLVRSFLDYPPDSVVTVGGLGMGATLVRADVFRALPPPWFRSDESGEDVYFFDRLRKAGIPAHLHTGIKCGHIGRAIVTEDDYRVHQSALSQTTQPVPSING
jgi:hypothetical protein